MEKEKYYIRNKMLSYRDLVTNTFLEVSIDALSEANGTWLSLNPATICFSLYDPKVNKNVSNIGICLRYDNAVRLFETVNSLFMASTDKKNIFTNGSVIQVPQYTFKNRKEIVFNFASDQNNQPVIQLTIIDTTSQRGKSSINLDMNAFKSIGKILKEFVETPISTNIGIKQLLSYDRVLENFNSMKNAICHKLITINDTINTAKRNSVDLNEYKEKPSEMSDMQKEFQEEFKKFSDIDIGLEKLMNKEQEFTKIDQLFISTCINHDLDKLREWATSFICITEKSSGELFAPLDFIFNISNISREDRTPYTNNFGYYPIQYALIFLLKKSVREAVQIGSYPNDIPALRFDTKFEKNTDMYNLSKEIITLFLLYSIVVNSFKDESEEIKRTYFTMKLLFSPFMFSINVDDGLVDELCLEYDKCYDSGMFRSIQDKYTSESYGGTLSINKEIFESCCNSFVKTLKTKQTITFNTEDDIRKIFNGYKISVPRKPIGNGEDIKRAIFELPDVEVKDKEIEPEIRESLPEERIEEDKKLVLFLDTIKGIADEELARDIKNTCIKYTELVSFFKTKDIPHELFKIKRVLDLDPNLTKSQILKKSKILKEDNDVTENRVMQEGYTEEGQVGNFNVQDILSIDGI